MSDAELNEAVSAMIGIRPLPSVRHVLERLKRDGVTSKVETTENPDNPSSTLHRVFIKPLAYRSISVTAETHLRAVRVALLVWLRFDPSAPATVKRALRVT